MFFPVRDTAVLTFGKALANKSNLKSRIQGFGRFLYVNIMEALKLEQGARFFEFGPFLVDGTKCVLLREGKIVPLNLKAFEILMVLIRNHSQDLEKDELFRQV